MANSGRRRKKSKSNFDARAICRDWQTIAMRAPDHDNHDSDQRQHSRHRSCRRCRPSSSCPCDTRESCAAVPHIPCPRTARRVGYSPHRKRATMPVRRQRAASPPPRGRSPRRKRLARCLPTIKPRRAAPPEARLRQERVTTSRTARAGRHRRWFPRAGSRTPARALRWRGIDATGYSHQTWCASRARPSTVTTRCCTDGRTATRRNPIGFHSEQ